MAIEYEIIEDKRLVIVKGSGVVTVNDILMHLDSLGSDTKYIAPMKKLVDHRSIKSLQVSKEEASRIARKKEILSKKFAGEKCAFITPTDLTYGSIRVHQALIDGADITTEVFRRIEDALEWLDVELDMDSE
ncbi:hypothetical protein ACFL2O_09345 [Thermodesulfobacteriota bacterium]